MSVIQRLLKIVFRSSKWEYLVKEQLPNMHKNPNKVSSKKNSQYMKDKLPIEPQLQQKLSERQNKPAPYELKMSPTSLLAEAIQKARFDKSSSNRYWNQKKEVKRSPKVIRRIKNGFSSKDEQFGDQVKMQDPHPEKEEQSSHIGIMKPTADSPEDALQSQSRPTQQYEGEQPAKQSNRLSQANPPFSEKKNTSISDILGKAIQRILITQVPNDSLGQPLKKKAKRKLSKEHKYDANEIKTDVNFQKQRRAKQSFENQTRYKHFSGTARQQSTNSIIAAKPQEDSEATQIHIIVPQQKSKPREIQVEDQSPNQSITDRNKSVDLSCSQRQLVREGAVAQMVKERKVSVVSSLRKTRKELIRKSARFMIDQSLGDMSHLVPNQELYERREEIRQGDSQTKLNAQIIPTQDQYIQRTEVNNLSKKASDQREAVIHQKKNNSNHLFSKKQTRSLRVHSDRKIFKKVELQAPKEETSQKSKFKFRRNQPQKEIELNEQDEYFRFNQELYMEGSESLEEFTVTRQSKKTKKDLIKELIAGKYMDEQQKGWQLQAEIRANWKSDEEMTIQQSIQRPLQITRINQGFSGFTTMTGWTARVTHFPSDWSIGMLEDTLDPDKTAIRQIKTKKHYFSGEQEDVFIDFHSAKCMADSLHDCSTNFKYVNSNLYRIILHHLEITHERGSSNQLRKGVQINFSDTTLDARQLEALASEYGEVFQIIEEYAEPELIVVFYFETSPAAQSFQAAMNQTLFGQQVLKARFKDTSLEELSKLTFKDDENEKYMSDRE